MPRARFAPRAAAQDAQGQELVTRAVWNAAARKARREIKEGYRPNQDEGDDDTHEFFLTVALAGGRVGDVRRGDRGRPPTGRRID